MASLKALKYQMICSLSFAIHTNVNIPLPIHVLRTSISTKYARLPLLSLCIHVLTYRQWWCHAFKISRYIRLCFPCDLTNKSRKGCDIFRPSPPPPPRSSYFSFFSTFSSFLPPHQDPSQGA